MTILVSNANGKVGQETARALLATGMPLRIGARDAAKAKANFPGAEAVTLDVLDPATHGAALAGVTAVFSAVPYELQPQGDRTLIASAKAAGVARYVKLSAMGVDADPTSPHVLAENSLRESGLGWTILRPNFFMQNYSTASAAAVKAGAFYEPAADGASSFIDARDIAAAAVAVLTTPGHAGGDYTLTGPAALTRAEVAAALTEASGHPVRYIPVDEAALRGAMAGAPAVLVDLMATLFGYVRAGWTARVTDDLPRLTGRPATPFSAFAKDHAAVWR